MLFRLGVATPLLVRSHLFVCSVLEAQIMPVKYSIIISNPSIVNCTNTDIYDLGIVSPPVPILYSLTNYLQNLICITCPLGHYRTNTSTLHAQAVSWDTVLVTLIVCLIIQFYMITTKQIRL